MKQFGDLEVNVVKENQRSYIGTCPSCGKEKHFYIHKTRPFHYICFRCGFKGTAKDEVSQSDLFESETINNNVIKLQDVDHMLMAKLLEINPAGQAQSAKDYLDSRLINVDIITKLGLGFDLWNNMISLPYLSKNKLIGMKYRRLDDDPPKYLYATGSNTGLYNGDSLKNEKYAILCEGEFDVLSILSNSDYKSVVGIPGASITPPVELFEQIHKIYICSDQDDVGEKAGTKWAEVLGTDRCHRVKFDTKDINEWFIQRQTKTREERAKDFALLLASAQPYDVPLVVSAHQYLPTTKEYLSRSKDVLKGAPTGVKDLDKYLGGIREREITLVTGDTSSGKSTFISWLLVTQLKNNVKCLLGSFEMSIEVMEAKLLSMDNKKNISRHGYFEGINPSILDNLYFIDRQGTLPLEELKRAIHDSYIRLGVRFVVLDHLHHFVQVADNETEWQALGSACREITEWVKKLKGLHLVLVVQFTKRQYDTIISKELIKGSSSITQNADNIIVLVREAGMKTKVMVEKTRSDAANGGPDARFYLVYNPETCGYEKYEKLKNE